MKIVYIAHPISGDVVGNIERVEKILKSIYERESAVVPFAPYLTDLRILNDADPAQRALGFKHNFALLAKCDELWVCNMFISNGMQMEINESYSLGIRVLFKGSLYA